MQGKGELLISCPINTDSKTVHEAAEEYEKEVRNVLKACKNLVLI